MEALKRYRTGGEQKVTVQHVSVSEGGQAIIGNVTQAARETTPETPAKLTPALTDARKPAMTIVDKTERTPGSGAPHGNKNALKNGRYTREAIEERQQLRILLRQARMLIQQIE